MTNVTTDRARSPYTADIEAQTFKFYDETNLNGSYNPRLGFIRKVYGIISAQLLVTFLFVVASQTFLKSWITPQPGVQATAAMALFYLATIGAIVTMLLVGCFTSLARTVPTNYILLGIFTICESYTVCVLTAFFPPTDVILAAFLTLSLTVALTVYAITTKKDFTVCGGVLCICAWSLFALTILLSMINFGNYKTLNAMNVMISVAAVCIYGVYLIFDTQLLIGEHRYSLDMDDYIIGAIIIYVDIIVLFVRILSILASLRDRS